MTVKEFFSKGLDCGKRTIECCCVNTGITKTFSRKNYLKIVKCISKYRNAEVIGSGYSQDVLHLDVVFADKE